MAGALHLLDQEVEALGGAAGGAGCVVGEDLGAPAGKRPPERVDFADRVEAAALARLVEYELGVGRVRGQVHTSRTDSLASQAPSTSWSGSPTRVPRSIRSSPIPSRRLAPVTRSFRIRYSGSRLRPRWPRV